MKTPMTLVATAMLSLVLLMGCTSAPTEDQTQPKEAENQAVTLLDEIKEAGVIRFGTEGTYAPFTFHGEDGKLTGFDVEVAEALAERLGVRAEFIETKWDGMFAGLDAKRFDAVANQVSIRSDRQEKYDFSKPYIRSRAVLIVKADNTVIKAFEDLKGKTSGQTLTSNFGELAQSYGAELVAVEGFNQSVDLLLSGRIDATVNDSLSFLDFMKQKPDSGLKMVDSLDEAEQSGILLRKGNPELVAAIDQALDAIIKDGTYRAISDKWFGEDVLK